MIKEKEISDKGGYQIQDVRERTKEIKQSIFKYNKFLNEEITLHGVRNVYGKELQRISVDWKNMVDSSFKAYNVGEQLYFVLTGFEKGHTMVNQKSAQGKATLKIFKLEYKSFENAMASGSSYELTKLHGITLNNMNIQYMNYKNTRPIAVNNNMIYYMRVFNDREE